MSTYTAPLNGGLYTGEPFAKGAPWANIPQVPDTDYMTHVALMSANPPADAMFQYPGYNRAGNNSQKMPGVTFSKAIACNSAPCTTSSTSPSPRFFKYYYF